MAKRTKEANRNEHTGQTSPGRFRRYQRAAVGTTVEVEIIAHSGDEFPLVPPIAGGPRRAQVSKGNVAYRVKGQSGEDISSFWRNYYAITDKISRRLGGRRVI